MITSFSNFFHNKFHNQTIAIYGLGREGQSTATTICKHVPTCQLHLIDDSDTALSQPWIKTLSKEMKIEIYQKDKYISLLNTSALPLTNYLYKSAGISPENALITIIKNFNIKIDSNTNTTFECIAFLKSTSDQTFSNITTIGVTGTKGKSTTTSLIYHILKEADKSTVLGGNIGIPPLTALSEVIRKYKGQSYLTLELSSHQLQSLNFSPNIAVVLDITPEHLDYYPSFEQYVEAKSHIVTQQTHNDFVVFNPNHTQSKYIAARSSGKKVEISEPDIASIDINTFKLKGKHNQENITHAIKVAEIFGIKKVDAVHYAQSFSGLPHRLEHVIHKNGIDYYNDSLATTPVATIAALDAFSSSKIILLVGGYDRGLDYEELVKKITQSDIAAVLGVGQTGKKIIDMLKKTPLAKKSIYAKTLEKAVDTAKKIAKEKYVILLSPASASFDQFKDYVERGLAFKTLVHKKP